MRAPSGRSSRRRWRCQSKRPRSTTRSTGPSRPRKSRWSKRPRRRRPWTRRSRAPSHLRGGRRSSRASRSGRRRLRCASRSHARGASRRRRMEKRTRLRPQVADSRRCAARGRSRTYQTLAAASRGRCGTKTMRRQRCALGRAACTARKRSGAWTSSLARRSSNRPATPRARNRFLKFPRTRTRQPPRANPYFLAPVVLCVCCERLWGWCVCGCPDEAPFMCGQGPGGVPGGLLIPETPGWVACQSRHSVPQGLRGGARPL
mmetsp:Transcript_34634/g.114744  ORF Transcript_34634/g.114744 Transcript_34634/m.114744 type:complete len:261 (+) Transcript_34634:803-1585(+)